MGLIACRIQFMLEAKNMYNVKFSDTVMLGRQKLWLSKRQHTRLRNIYGISGAETGEIDFRNRVYAEKFLQNNFMIEKLSILDYSGYEGADIIHDMNTKIPVDLEQKYDVVIDGGSLEHIFNFPIAISNCMNMLKKDGSIFIFSMANNHCGHGFYQFAPELFFRVFEPANGFEIKSVVLVEHPFPGAELSERTICHSVKDPSFLGYRGSLISKSPLGIMIHAIKTEHKKLFQTSPLQSDYNDSWELKSNTKDVAPRKKYSILDKANIYSFIKSIVPFKIRNTMAGYKQLQMFSIKNKRNQFSKWPS